MYDSRRGMEEEKGRRDILLFANTMEKLVVAVRHDEMHSDEVVDGPETAGRDVTLN